MATAMAAPSREQHEGRWSGRATQRRRRAPEKSAPRTVLPAGSLVCVWRACCRGERRGEVRGGESWRLRSAGNASGSGGWRRDGAVLSVLAAAVHEEPSSRLPDTMTILPSGWGIVREGWEVKRAWNKCGGMVAKP